MSCSWGWSAWPIGFSASDDIAAIIWRLIGARSESDGRAERMTRMLGGLVLLGLSIAVLVYLTYVLVRPDRF